MVDRAAGTGSDRRGDDLGCFLGYSRIEPPIRVGILHSKTGAMAISEESMIDAEVLALTEINQSGGLLGRRVDWVIADGQSDWPTFAREAQRLIDEEKVSVIFGCWTSASRKSVKPVVEERSHLLIYPMAYEGLEQSQNIIYTGAAPNQQVIPAVSWCYETLKAQEVLPGRFRLRLAPLRQRDHQGPAPSSGC